MCACMRMCSVAYPACNVHAPYCVIICVPSGSMKFFDVSQTARFSERKVIGNKMCVLIFSTTLVWSISDSKNNWARYCHRCENVLMWRTCYSCRVTETWTFLTDCRKKKSSNIKFRQNSCSVSRIVSCGRTDMAKLIVAFRTFANHLKSVYLYDYST
jgi:hypothetical protein